MVREGLALLLSRHEALHVVAQAASIEEALALTIDHVDLVLLDISMPERSGLEAVPDVRERWPQAQIVIVTVHAQATYGDAAARLGAAGFISKSARPGEIRDAVLHVAAGGTWFPDGDTSAPPRATPPDLTAREREILALLARGERATDIASTLQLSVKTVSGHKVRLAKKLGAANSEQIGLLAREMGLLD
jgi:DNA-binding NarL/FixJ family response regulator